MSPEKAEELLSLLLRYEQVLLELKVKGVGLAAQTPTPTDAEVIQGSNLNGNYADT